MERGCTWLNRNSMRSPSAASRSGSTPVARHARGGRARADDARGRRHRRHFKPDDLPEGDLAGHAYDEQIKELLEHEDDPKEIFFRARARRHGGARPARARPREDRLRRLRLVEVARRSRTTAREPSTGDAPARGGRPPESVVKIPATKPGLGAIEDSVAHGKNINVTLIFSLERYAEVVEAYLRGLERLVASGGNPKGQLGGELLRLARGHRDGQAAGGARQHEAPGKLAIANAKLAYEHFRRVPGRALGVPDGKGARRRGRCGRRPRRRIPPIATRCTSRS